MSSNARAVIRESFAGVLEPGACYTVKRSFLDAAKAVHPAGESWTYAGYLPSGSAAATYIFTADGSGQPRASFAIAWDEAAGSVFSSPQDYFGREDREV